MRTLVRTVAVALVPATVLAAVLCAAAPGALADTARDRQWHLKYLNVAAAQQIRQGEGIKVGLPDTGVDDQVPELHGVVVGGMASGPLGVTVEVT